MEVIRLTAGLLNYYGCLHNDCLVDGGREAVSPDNVHSLILGDFYEWKAWICSQQTQTSPLAFELNGEGKQFDIKQICITNKLE